MESNSPELQCESLLEHLRICKYPLETAPDFPTDSKVSLSHPRFVEYLQKLPDSNELGFQTIVVGYLVTTIEYDEKILFAGGNPYPEFTTKYIKSLCESTASENRPANQENSKKRKMGDSKEKSMAPPLKKERTESTTVDAALANFVKTHSTGKLYNDFALFYKDKSLGTSISIVNFEVKKEQVDSIYSHKDFIKVLLSLSSYYPFLKDKLEMNSAGFSTSSILIGGSSVWILHFVINEDPTNSSILQKILYISSEYSLKNEKDTLAILSALQWAVNRGLSNIKVFQSQKSSTKAIGTPQARLSSNNLIVHSSFSLKKLKIYTKNLGTLTKQETLERLAKSYPDLSYEEKEFSKDDFLDLVDKTKFVIFATKDEFGCLNSNANNYNRVIVYDKYKVLFPIETDIYWKIEMDEQTWKSIISKKPASKTAFDAPSELYITPDIMSMQDLVIKIETNSDPIVLKKLTECKHSNIMRVVKIIEVDQLFTATVNEKLYPLTAIYDPNNPNNRLGRSEIEDLKFCMSVVLDAWNGLKFLKGNNIYYKDISFNNIMLTPDLTTAKLIDFEACTTNLFDWNQISTYTGVYTPNEQYNDKSHVYSLVVVLCEIVFMVLAHHYHLDNQPKSIGYSNKFQVTKPEDIPSASQLKQFILMRFAKFFPQHLYFVQFFADKFILNQSQRSVELFEQSLNLWKHIFEKEESVKKKTGFKYNTIRL